VKATLVIIALVIAARPVDAKGCHDPSNVVGYRHCSLFGGWSRDADLPVLVVDFGFMHHRFTTASFDLAPEPTLVADATDHATGASLGDMRVLAGVGRVFYTGVEFGGGGLTRAPHLGLGDEMTFDVLTHVVLGVHVSPMFRFSFGVELAGGGSIAQISVCRAKPCPDGTIDDQARAELEVRAIAEVWVTPQFTIGAGIGKSLVQHDDTLWTVFIGGHVVAMDRM
jgi:hypothetical protein